MRKTVLNLLIWILVIIIGFGLVHILNQNNKKKDENVLIVGYDDTFVPMGFINNDGQVVGFDIDLAKAVGKKIHKEIKFQPIDWTMKETELRNGDIDLIWNGYSVTKEREEQVDFSNPYISDRQVIIVRSNSNIKDKNDFKDKKIGVQAASSASDAVMKDSGFVKSLRGGMTSHAAVVARGMGTCCVAGCGELKVNEDARMLEVNGNVYTSNDFISIDGTTGNIYGEKIKTVTPEITGHFATFMEWVDGIRKLKVRTNADTPRDAKQAVEFGAEGIGLCRTEHMFFAEDRILAVREMIIAKTEEERRKALNKILPMQKADFIGIYEALKGMPATIRLLDPPLHEFLPHTEEDKIALAKELDVDVEDIKLAVDSKHEFNPMMGHRGCRLAVTYPEIAEMQTRAIIEAAIAVNIERGYNVVPEIMIPLVGEIKELKYVKDVIVETAEKVMAEKGTKIEYTVGTMIEIPRAALTADEIAKEAEFFSFGTNDLTQMTFGFSRDDAAKFLSSYYERGIYEQDPFAKLDQNGVGQLVKMAAEKGRSTREDIKLGICGEHGGDPSSVEFCHNIGLNYVSCSPFRVPLARLAAAQAQVKNKR